MFEHNGYICCTTERLITHYSSLIHGRVQSKQCHKKDTTTHCINNSHRWLKQRVQTMVDLITDPELVVMTEKGDFWPSTCWVKNSEFIS